MNTSSDRVTTSQSLMQRGNAYLQFQLTENISAALEIKYIQEIVTVPLQSIAMIPNMPESMVGLMNWRDRIIWTIDLGMLFNLGSMYNIDTDRYNLITIRVKSKTLGFIVPNIQGTVNLLNETIQSSRNNQMSESALNPYLHGCAYRDGKQMLILDVVGICESAKLWSDRDCDR